MRALGTSRHRRPDLQRLRGRFLALLGRVERHARSVTRSR
jgi:hypothetical protein